MAMHVDDVDGFGAEAPHPVDAASIERGSFEHLQAGQGAAAPRRRTSKQEVPSVGKRAMVAVVCGSLAVIALLTVLFVRAINAPAPMEAPEPKAGQTAVAAGQATVAADDRIEYRNVTYALVESAGGYALAELQEGGRVVPLGELSGAPAALILFDGALVVPQNHSDGTWDVMAYTIGAGWSQIMDSSGNAQVGHGTISQAHLDGSALVLLVDGSEVSLPLVW